MESAFFGSKCFSSMSFKWVSTISWTSLMSTPEKSKDSDQKDGSHFSFSWHWTLMHHDIWSRTNLKFASIKFSFFQQKLTCLNQPLCHEVSCLRDSFVVVGEKLDYLLWCTPGFEVALQHVEDTRLHDVIVCAEGLQALLSNCVLVLVRPLLLFFLLSLWRL